MDHGRIFRTVLGVTAGYLILLGVWLGWVLPHTPPGTEPYQVMGLVGLFGSCAGVGMLFAARPSKADRRLQRYGLEGWAKVAGVYPVRQTDHRTELTELDLELTVPGSDSYRGKVLFDVTPVDKPRLAVGETVSIRVDPANRDRIILVL